MNINFFEEYPTEENLSKLNLVDWPATVLVAAPSLTAFETIKERYSSRYPHITFGWWPILPGSYWVSAFSDPKTLERLFGELTSKVHTEILPVLIDLELPLRPGVYVRNIFNFRRNKKAITAFFQKSSDYNLKLYTAEYAAPNNIVQRVWKLLGISPSFDLPHTKLPMVYTSMGKKSFGEKAVQRIQKYEKIFCEKHPGRVGFGLGTIATGVLGNEPILPPRDLTLDFTWAKDAGAEEVFIFRLGGLNEEYISQIKSIL